VISNWSICETGDEFVCESHALRRSKRISPGITVVFSEGLVVVVLVPFIDGEEVAERGDLAGARGDGIEGAKIHHVNCLDCG